MYVVDLYHLSTEIEDNLFILKLLNFLKSFQGISIWYQFDLFGIIWIIELSLYIFGTEIKFSLSE